MTDKTKRRWTLLFAFLLPTLFLIVEPGFREDPIAGDRETYEGLKLFSDVIELIEKNYVDEVDAKDLIHKAVKGMVQSLDPHSQFLPPEAFEELQIDTKGEFGGIGIVIAHKNQRITVIAPIEGTPAYRAGILAGDIITRVDGEETKDMALWEAVKLMRGPQGTPVTITVWREGEPKELDFALVRDIIPVQSVKHASLKPGFGYVWITNFREDTTTDLIAALDALDSDEAPLKGLILDLRDNPGGLLDEAIKVSDVFLEKGVIVTIRGRQSKNTKNYKASHDSTDRTFPLVVLTNGGSASASEIVAGALQDQKRALILGTTSFGKGSVQSVATLREGYGLKFTVARYYTPSGRSIQAQGIEPDIVVQRGLVDDDEASEMESHRLKEKDLRNHLEAEPEDGSEADVMDGGPDGAEDEEIEPAQYRHGPLDRERLLSDRQVVRALQLLIGFDLFAAK